MEFGMLWLDDDAKRPFEDKVKRAAEYYKGKYGRKPDFCLVNQKTVKEAVNLGKISVVPDRSISPNHFLIGLRTA